MNHTAYLVIHIDTTASPPVVRSAGIYSEPHPSGTGDIRPVELHRHQGNTYAEAKRWMENFIMSTPHMMWVKKLMGA